MSGGIEGCLVELKSALVEALPETRIVTRRWRDSNEYSVEKLKQGILTILHKAGAGIEDDYPHVKILLIGLVRVSADLESDSVETAENELLQELVNATRSQISYLRILSYTTSHQVEHPKGWFVAEAEYGPVNLVEEPEDGFAADVLASRSPEIGADHVDDYENVETEFDDNV